MFNHLNDKQDPAGDNHPAGTNSANINTSSNLPVNNNQQPVAMPSPMIHAPKTTESVAPPVPAKYVSPKISSNMAVDDIFSETDSGLNDGKEKPGVFQSKQEDPTMAGEVSRAESNYDDEPVEGGLRKKILFGVIGVVGLIVLIGAGYWTFNKFMAVEIISEDEKDPVVEIDKLNEDAINKQPPVPVTSKSKDTDSDGLNDSEELELGTAIGSNDTDRDGLFDREEVRVYGTNPLVADTDGDGFTDGQEVKEGYNPKGSGKLYKK